MENKSKLFILLPFLALGAFQACTTTESKSTSPRVPKVLMENSSLGSLSTESVAQLKQTVFEILTPKYEDSFIQYAEPLPYAELPFNERNDRYNSIGTAFSIEADRFISAAHVFDLQVYSINRKFFIRDSEGNVYPIKNIYRYSQQKDLVEFDVMGMPKQKMVLEAAHSADVGEVIFTVGNAQGEGISIRGGHISSFTPEETSGAWKFIRYSAPTSPGNSGGPLLNEQGKVVGVVTRKNSQENLNYAVPIQLLIQQSTQHAEFSSKGSVFVADQEKRQADWSFKAKLPESLTGLSTIATSAYHEFFKKLKTDFFAENQNRIFPYSPGFNEYVINGQPMSPFFSEVVMDQNKNWGAKKNEFKKEQIGPEQHILVAGENGSYQYVVQKPPRMSLLEFISDQKLVLDLALKNMDWSRTFASKEIRIRSYGKPQQQSLWKDKLNRTWIVSFWQTQIDDHFLLNTCLPLPEGMACNLYHLPNSSETFGIKSLLKYQLDRHMISYLGKLSAWQEFLELPKSLLPGVFQTASLNFYSNRAVSYRFGEFSGRHALESIDRDSQLMAYTGYDPDQVLAQKILGLVLIPNAEQGDSLMVLNSTQPLDSMGEKAQKEWETVTQRSSPYDGRIFPQGKTNVMYNVIQPPRREPASIKSQSIGRSHQDRRWIVSCSFPTHVEKQTAENICNQFTSSFKTGKSP